MRNKLTSFFSSFIVIALISGCGRSEFPLVVAPEPSDFGQSFSYEYNALGQSTKSVVLNFNKTPNQFELQKLENKYQAKISRIIPQIGIAVAEPVINTVNSSSFQSAALVGAFARSVTNDQLVDNAEPLNLVRIEDVQGEKLKKVSIDDPEAEKQYHLNLLEMDKVWAINSGKNKVKIAILDTGIDLNHPDLKDRLIKGINILNPKKQPMDDNGHGTHVAGIAAASTNNGIGVAGIAPDCSVIPVKVLDRGRGSDVDIAEGIVWAADQGADVVNLSVGVYTRSIPMEKAVSYALRKGVVIVSSAGNEGKNSKIHYPSMIKGVIEVSASTKSDRFSNFSNFGQKISVAAPGDSILSTMPTYNVQLTSEAGKRYGFLSGTSMASPMVSGFAALLKSTDKSLSPAKIKELIESNSTDLGNKGYDKFFGHGRIDIYGTLKNLN